MLAEQRPDVAVFLGDTNTVMGSIAAGQLNIPIVHIEGCMRSYDWRMPEEKYRTVIDHLSDVIYTYFDEYKEQGIREGFNPRNIVVIQNLIVDVLQHYYFDREGEYDAYASDAFFAERNLERDRYYLMTCHRRESVESSEPLQAILEPDLAKPVADLLHRQLPDPEAAVRVRARATTERDHGRSDRLPASCSPCSATRAVR